MFLHIDLYRGSVISHPIRGSVISYWASEASPTLGCSIEISRDICIYVYMSVCLVCQINCVGGIT